MEVHKKLLILILFTLLLTGCGSEKYKINENTTLKGKITNTEVTKDNETKNVTILNLDEPIIIDGTKINKIEIDYDKDLKNDYDVEINGTIKENKDKDSVSYSFEVTDIEDVLSFVNTFANKDFSFAVPSDIIKLISIKEIDNGFAFYDSTDSYEILTIESVSKQEFNKLLNSGNVEKAASNREKVIIIKFNINSENTNEISKEIFNNIQKIKTTVQIK